MTQTFPERGSHADILRLADGKAVWFDPACTACAAGHHPAELPTLAQVAIWDAAVANGSADAVSPAWGPNGRRYV